MEAKQNTVATTTQRGKPCAGLMASQRCGPQQLRYEINGSAVHKRAQKCRVPCRAVASVGRRAQ
ncbi:hypothetical protein DOTSEDRAFT_48753 [Dothistroma septosporum NZE10]|uniref:Uncharacterized protein n=1 Tax=Dothistroma septosporum (strain NZE10 / CBS 128990) TaxID=675120 RepID=N1PEL8_DOTSN|nr:hypothetical protein DOTSEDRAFT_48753 [Dothistroma septosporum NZE10]